MRMWRRFQMSRGVWVARLTALGVCLALVPVVTADVNMQYVLVGNAGNGGHVTTAGTYGAVSYEYKIGKYLVTNTQYTEFLNVVAAADPRGLYNVNTSGITRSGASGGYSYSVAGGKGEHPVDYVSFWDACRFANWLHNGQPTGLGEVDGSTEDGAYDLNVTNPTYSTISRDANAQVWIPDENEWHKAAYHKNDGVTANYWDYATQSDEIPAAQGPPGGANSANYSNAVGGLTNVGAYTASGSAYDTFDQNGNMFDWVHDVGASEPCIRGGAYNTSGSAYLRSPGHISKLPTDEMGHYGGIRVATVPEPATMGLLGLGMMGLVLRRRRR